MRRATAILALTAVGALAQAIRKEAPNPESTSGAIQRRVAPPARITRFNASPTTIRPGQQATLTWATENPSGVTLEPLGSVAARGSLQVSPAATTTYKLTVHGPNDQVLTREVTVTIPGTAPATSNVPARQEVPRLADGRPDLSGVYTATGGPGARGGRGAAADGPQLKPGAEKYRVVRGPNDPGLTSDCMPLAGPQAFSVPYQFQIVEGTDHVAILNEYPGDFRIVPTGGGPHQADLDPTWVGDSIGRWEGDTLVVDTIGFNEKTEISGFKHSEALHVVERFTRPAYGTLQYEATLEDPNVWVKQWKVTRTFALRPDLAKIDEFVCETNEDYGKFFKKE